MKVEVTVLGFRPNEPYGFCGRKATLNRAYSYTLVICQPDIRGRDIKHYIIIGYSDHCLNCLWLAEARPASVRRQCLQA